MFVAGGLRSVMDRTSPASWRCWPHAPSDRTAVGVNATTGTPWPESGHWQGSRPPGRRVEDHHEVGLSLTVPRRIAQRDELNVYQVICLRRQLPFELRPRI